MEYQVVLLAAGSGVRSSLSYNKVFYKINDKTIFEMSIEKFINDEDCQKIVVTYKEKENFDFQKLINSPKVVYVTGGKTRKESVFNALKHIDSSYVLIHDAARPHFTDKLLENLKENLKYHNCVIPVIDIKDTIKIVKNDFVQETINRDLVKFVQTPQGFKTDDLKFVHNNCSKDEQFSDDSAMIEKILKKEVYCIHGEISNKKYTSEDDFR